MSRQLEFFTMYYLVLILIGLALLMQTCAQDCSGPHFFLCPTNGKCIPTSYRCDGDDDCGDESDESDCGSAQINQHFRCSNGLVNVPDSFRCDGDNDCHDNSDEIGCSNVPFVPARRCPDPIFFRCANNGKCILGSFRCDGDNDCGDNSDETGCNRTQPVRPHFRCNNGRVIPLLFRCDGDSDCSDNSDETGCTNITRGTGALGRFRCTNGLGFIPSRLRCDGDGDCDDNSDEADCANASSASQYRCTNGRFVRSIYRCDGDNDCDDNSDENDCDERRLELFRFRCTNGRAVQSRLRCNGENDCQDGTDEAGCPPVMSSQPFQCTNNRIVPGRYRCDGDNDCVDNSDEVDCENVLRCTGAQYYHSCYLKHASVLELSRTGLVRRFKTTPGCIEQSRLCDGIADCSDGSDELNCTRCVESEFQCDNKRCVLLASRCDGNNDCGDNSDELRQHCPSTNNPTSAEAVLLNETRARSGQLPPEAGEYSLQTYNTVWQIATIAVSCLLLVFVLVTVVTIVKLRNAKQLSQRDRYTALASPSTVTCEQDQSLYATVGVHYARLNDQ